jgi:predicted Fe-Mo cluster-binding NifX family protein
MKIAIPLAEGKLAMHFGHCEQFALLDVDESGSVTAKEEITPPPHEPGLLPAWLHELGATHIIAGGMGSRAQGLFKQNDIEVIVGAPSMAPEELVSRHVGGTLENGENVCDH